jgi:hypothetical protein
MAISFFSSPAKIAITALAAGAFLLSAGCAAHRYSNPGLSQKAIFTFPPLYDTIIEPLHAELIPIYKRIFFLKNDVNELKDRLWDGGSDQRIMRIDNNIDILKDEINALSAIRRELLNTIYYIYPPYENPQVLPYGSKNKAEGKNAGNVILISLEDLQEYQNAKSNDEKLSEEIDYKPLLATAMKKFEMLPDSLRKPIQPIGTPGPVARIRPYTPPPLYR